MIGIYRIVCIPTGECYIGQSKDIERRWSEHDDMLMNGNHHSKKLQAAFNRWGPLFFVKTIIQLIPQYSKPTLDKLEKMYIRQFNSYHRGFNMTIDG